ncbi:MAG: hypothetical protein QW273_03990 [Candidatus Pacearchaeota archaeon]
MKKKYFILLLSFLFILIVFLVWYYFFYFSNCSNEECFFEKLAKCSKATYSVKESWAYSYKILGAKEEKCAVEVKLLFAGGEPKFSSLIGKKMICYLPLRYLEFPENDLSFCEGPLKEEVQYLLIKDAYTFLFQKLGKEE